MAEPLSFASRHAFRDWLAHHCLSGSGAWLLFGKPGGPNTLKASEAPEEALCFGWIDGQMQRIDDAKTDAGCAKRLSWMMARLNENQKPM